jgi:hypothetical protein
MSKSNGTRKEIDHRLFDIASNLMTLSGTIRSKLLKKY